MMNEWLERRKIDPELAHKFGIEVHGGEIRVPYFVGSEAVNHKYRSLTDKRHRQDKGGVKAFWNYNVMTDDTLADQPLIITEGEWDALAAIQAGFVRVVSVPDGAPSTEIGDGETTKYGYLDHARAALRDVREIIIAVDGDEAGQRLLNDLALRLGKARCKWVKYPKGCKDLNDALMTYGERGVTETINRAQYVHVDGVYRMSELPPYPERKGVSTGMPWLDPHYRVRMGDFAVITGIPGYGKTTFVNDLCCRLANQYGWTIGWASFEQHPQADHRRALRNWYLDVPSTNADLIAEADRWIDRHFSFIVPSDEELASLDWLLDAMATSVIRHGAKVLVVDPWNEIDHVRDNRISQTEYVGMAIKELKRFARKFDVHLIVVAHPAKLQGGEEPGLYSISDSAHWANKADVGLVIHKEDPTDTLAKITVKKSRYHEHIGRPGTVYAHYNADTRKFVGVPPELVKGAA